MAAASTVEKIKSVWAVVELVVQECIQAAEVLYVAPKSGAEKKAYVRDRVLEFLTELEAKHNLVPGALEGPAFGAARFVLDLVIERVLRKTVNAAPATT